MRKNKKYITYNDMEKIVKPEINKSLKDHNKKMKITLEEVLKDEGKLSWINKYEKS